MSLSNRLKQDFPLWFCDTPYSQETQWKPDSIAP
jgi:hypothetical protein